MKLLDKFAGWLFGRPPIVVSGFFILWFVIAGLTASTSLQGVAMPIQMALAAAFVTHWNYGLYLHCRPAAGRSKRVIWAVMIGLAVFSSINFIGLGRWTFLINAEAAVLIFLSGWIAWFGTLLWASIALASKRSGRRYPPFGPVVGLFLLVFYLPIFIWMRKDWIDRPFKAQVVA